MNYLIEGLSGTGKTSVCHELQKRGYNAIDADEAFGFFGNPKTGEPTKDKSQLNWLWDKEKVKEQLSEPRNPTFVCGGAMNQQEFRHFFEEVFTLYVNNEIMKRRLLTRENNDFGKDPKDLARQLEWNKGAEKYAKERGTVIVDASKSVFEIVDKILSLL